MPESTKIAIDPDTPFLKPLVEKLGRHPKRIVFPEGNDPRILRVAAKLVELKLAAPVLLGDPAAIADTAASERISIHRMLLLDPVQSSDFDLFCQRFVNIEHFRREAIDDPAAFVSRPDYFAGMMVQYGQADAVVGGNQELPAALFRTLLRVIKTQPDVGFASSAVALELPEHLRHLGKNGVLVLADTAIVREPTVEQLATIAVEAGKLATLFHGGESPKVALLSYANKGSAPSPSSERVAAATALARTRADREFTEMDIDGELQVDVALVPEISERKCGRNLIHGQADVLVFPDLNSGHISAKLLQHVAGAQPYGHMILGLARPVAQVSRVANEQTIFGSAVAMGVKAIKFREIIAAEA